MTQERLTRLLDAIDAAPQVTREDASRILRVFLARFGRGFTGRLVREVLDKEEEVREWPSL